MARSGTLTRARDVALLENLLGGKTVKAAAIDAGIPLRSAWRIANKPEFQTALREARGELLSGVLNRLHTCSGEACDTLREIAVNKSPGRYDSARVRASEALLNTLLKAHESIVLAERVTELERALGNDVQKT
jgi:hypothetical protein